MESPVATGTVGHTGVPVTRMGFGSVFIGQPGVPEQQAIEMVQRALDRGITLFDTGLDSVFRASSRQAARPACARVANCTGLRYPSVECRRWRWYQTSLYAKIATRAAARVGQSWRSTSATLREAKHDAATAWS